MAGKYQERARTPKKAVVNVESLAELPETAESAIIPVEGEETAHARPGISSEGPAPLGGLAAPENSRTETGGPVSVSRPEGGQPGTEGNQLPHAGGGLPGTRSGRGSAAEIYLFPPEEGEDGLDEGLRAELDEMERQYQEDVKSGLVELLIH